MTYCWALSGILERPYFVREEFFVNAMIAKEGPGVEPILLAPLVQVYEKAAFLSGLTIAVGRSLTMPVTAVAYDGDKPIASVEHSSAYTDPDYRGRGIMGELIAEFEVHYPDWMLYREATGHARSFTNGGAASLRKAYRLMVQRGAVIPERGDNSWQKDNSPFQRRMSRLAASR
jgi:GNAT superfamily N-acetyltransferase